MVNGILRLFVAFVVLLLVGIAGCEQKPAGGRRPDFELPGPGSTAVSDEDLSGKVVLVDFWASWCHPCIESIPHLNSIHQRFADRGAMVLGINVDEERSLEWLGEFAAENGIEYPVVKGSFSVMGKFGPSSALPTAYVLDPKGEVVRMIPGMVTEEHYARAIEQALNAAPPEGKPVAPDAAPAEAGAEGADVSGEAAPAPGEGESAGESR